MSLGILGGGGQSKKMARPLTFDQQARGVRGVGSLRGLAGALGDVVPWQCWDKSGFKDCHAKSWAKAEPYCKSLIADDKSMYGGDVNSCISQVTDAYDWQNCVPTYCPPAKGAGGISWRNTTPNATVSKLQAALNVYLKSMGYDQLGVDGKLGSGTCGAAYYIDDWKGTTFYRDYGLAKVCQTLKVPTKSGKPVMNVGVAPQVTITKTESVVAKTDLPWDVFDEDTAEVQRRLNIQLDSADMNLLNVSGKLDAPTCGAMKWQKDTQGFDVLSTSGQNCQGFTAPTRRMKASTPVVIPPASSVTPTSTLPAPVKSSQASMATTGLVLGAVGVGIWALNKHFHWFG